MQTQKRSNHVERPMLDGVADRMPEIPTVARSGQIDNARIAKRAYELFMARGCRHGNHDGDWYQAERELRMAKK